MPVSIAVVTGANKGIGYAIVETLAQKLSPNDWRIYLTARDQGRGTAALEEFHKKGYSHVHFHLLDIENDSSIVAFRDYIKQNYDGGLKILINNAAIAFGFDSTVPFEEQTQKTMMTNVWSNINVCKHLFPLLAQDAKVVHVASTVGTWAMGKLNADLKQKFASVTKIQDLVALARQFEDDVKAGNHESKGWPSMAYGISKLVMIALAKVQAIEMKDDPRNIVINSCCPGYVDTDMSAHRGTKTITEGAVTPCYLALLSGHEPNGKFVSELKVVDWEKGEAGFLV